MLLAIEGFLPNDQQPNNTEHLLPWQLYKSQELLSPRTNGQNERPERTARTNGQGE